MTPAQRAELTDAMSRDARELALAGLRMRHPQASEAALLDAYARLTLSPALAEAVVEERARRASRG